MEGEMVKPNSITTSIFFRVLEITRVLLVVDVSLIMLVSIAGA